MVITIIIWFYAGCVSYLTGHLLLKTIFPKHYTGESLDAIFQAFFTGFAAVNFFGSFLSLFLPTGLISNLILTALLLTGYVSTHTHLPNWTSIQKPCVGKLKQYLFLIVVIGLVLVTAYTTSGTAKNTDSYLYHAQSIHWIESYPAIKGLGNFFIRFAYNSSWFIQTSLFSFSFLGGTSFHVMTGLLFAAFSLLVLKDQLFQDRAFLPESLMGFILLPMAILTLGSELSSPSTDLPSALLIWLVLYFSFQFLREGSHPPALEFTILLTSILAVTVKLSSIPIVLIAVLLTLRHLVQKDWKKTALLIMAAVLCFTPWVLRSIIQSGYLIYPVEFTGLPVGWKIPSRLLQEDVAHIRVWGFDKVINTDQVMSKPYLERMAFWFQERTMNQKILFLGAIFTPLFSTPLLYFMEKKKLALWVPFLTSCTGLLYWVLISPNIRFGYAWLLIINAIFFGVGIQFLLRLFQKKNRIAALTQKLILAGLASLLLLSLALSVRNIFHDVAEPLSARILFQMDYLPRSAEPCEIYQTDVSVLCAKDYYECGYHNFPCFPWEPLIGLYDETNLRKGFYPIIKE